MSFNSIVDYHFSEILEQKNNVFSFNSIVDYPPIPLIARLTG
ncbi:hypothetical protein J5U22_01689 [Saccharolobus shibatae]|uniref:Uncharacterized protein n=1 Tax=Saccharolobus shibatae TaxID=2286 RepID=A0A8F5C145_9CREN|nr:hypothetical protein J5U22_01689 [Saccharolobus shibatae]